MSTESKIEETKYAILMETSGEECESWYYFIKHNGNEIALNHLKNQIDQTDMYVLDDLSAFDIELEHLVSEQTASEMIRIEVNSITFHRKFDGKLEIINFDLRKKDKNDSRLQKINDIIGMGEIENFVKDEDIPPENVASDSDSDTDDELVPLPLNIKFDQNILLLHKSGSESNDNKKKKKKKSKSKR